MLSDDERIVLTRGLQKLLGAVVSVTGTGLAGFALLLLYADWLRDLPSTLVVYTVMGACGLAGGFCLAVGLRLVRGRPTAADPVLLSAGAWTLIGGVFVALGVFCLLTGRLRLFFLCLVLGGLCLLGGQAVRRARRRYRLG